MRTPRLFPHFWILAITAVSFTRFIHSIYGGRRVVKLIAASLAASIRLPPTAGIGIGNVQIRGLAAWVGNSVSVRCRSGWAIGYQLPALQARTRQAEPRGRTVSSAIGPCNEDGASVINRGSFSPVPCGASGSSRTPGAHASPRRAPTAPCALDQAPRHRHRQLHRVAGLPWSFQGQERPSHGAGSNAWPFTTTFAVGHHLGIRSRSGKRTAREGSRRITTRPELGNPFPVEASATRPLLARRLPWTPCTG